MSPLCVNRPLVNIRMDFLNDDIDDSEIDRDVDTIMDQIRNRGNALQKINSSRIPLKKEDMEDFIIQNAANVVRDSVSMVERLKDEVMAGADSKLIESVSELVKATSSAIDSLTKLKITEDKINAQKDITRMNIDSRADTTLTSGVLLSREDVIKALMAPRDSGKIIDATVIND